MRCHLRMAPWQSPRRISLQLLPLQITGLQHQPKMAAPSRYGGGRSLRRRPRGQLLCSVSMVFTLLSIFMFCGSHQLFFVWRFIQQVNQAAVTIQRWYRRHAESRHANKATLKRIFAGKKKVSSVHRLLYSPFFTLHELLSLSLSSCSLTPCMCLQEWEERSEQERSCLEQQQKKDEARKRIREEKARLAHLAVIQGPTVCLLWAISILLFIHAKKYN